VRGATIVGEMIARETVRALRKDMTSKCSGGNPTLMKKLLPVSQASDRASG